MPTNTNTIVAAADALINAGFRGPAVESKVRILDKLLHALAQVNTRPASTYFVPGRIEVLGKHVDYAGGRSLTCATEQGFSLAVAPRDDWRVRMIDPINNLESSFPLDANLEPLAGDWTNYPMTVARRIARNFNPRGPGKLTGCDITFTSDLPQAAGLSSSSAMVVALFMAIADVNQLQELPEYTEEITSDLDLGDYLGCVENGLNFGTLIGDRGVGTKGGCQDQTAIVCAEAGTLGQFTYRPVQLEQRIRLPDQYVFAIGVSGVHSQKTGNTLQQYNRASQLAHDASALWCKETGRHDDHLAAAVASAPDALARLRGIIAKADEPLQHRVEQFLDETYRIVPRAGDALEAGDLETFGKLTDQSQRGAETKLGNQVPQTVHLAKHARELGAAAASAFGAGFGGSVWALVHTDQAETFIQNWSDDYRKAFPDEANDAAFITTRPAPPAMRLG
jgi:galactokinase